MLDELAKILKKLDVATDNTDRLIGADWLEERGYTPEASFYRWLVAAQLEPYHTYLNHWEWYAPRTSDFLYFRHPDTARKAVVSNQLIWAEIESYFSNLVQYNSRTVAIQKLRLAFIKVSIQHGYRSATATNG